MEGGISMDILQKVIIEPFRQFYEQVLQFLPNFLSSLLILIIGIIIGKILQKLFSKLFTAIHLDRFSERSGLIDLLKKGGVKEAPSVILSKIVGWIAIITFATISLRALEIRTIEILLERFLLYLPSVFVAALILIAGYLLGNFLGRAALIASVNAGIRIAGLIGKFVKFTVFLLAATMALEQLGIGKETVAIAFAITFGGVILALAIAFGLGGRDAAREYLEKKIKNVDKKDEISHL